MTIVDKSKVLIRIVDDDPVIRKSVGFMLSYEGYNVKTWDNARDFIRDDAPSVPGCIVLDIKMPGMTGLELQKLLVQRHSETPIIFLTAHGDIESAVESMKDGAFDFLQKPLNPQKFLTIVERCVQDDFMRKKIGMSQEELGNNWRKLSDREKETAKLAAQGMSSSTIAERLGLSPRTVENHRASAYKKLAINSLEHLKNLVNAISN